MGKKEVVMEKLIISFDWDETLVKLLANTIAILKPVVSNMLDKNKDKENNISRLNKLKSFLNYKNRNEWKKFILKVKKSKGKDFKNLFSKLPEEISKEIFNDSTDKLFEEFIKHLKIELKNKPIDKTPEIEGSIKLLNQLVAIDNVYVAITTNNATDRFLKSLFLQITDEKKAEELTKSAMKSVESKDGKNFHSELEKVLEENFSEQGQEATKAEWKKFIKNNIVDSFFPKASGYETEEEYRNITSTILASSTKFAVITKNSRKGFQKPNRELADELKNVFNLKPEEINIIHIGDKSKVDVGFSLNNKFNSIHYTEEYGDYEGLEAISEEAPHTDYKKISDTGKLEQLVETNSEQKKENKPILLGVKTNIATEKNSQTQRESIKMHLIINDKTFLQTAVRKMTVNNQIKNWNKAKTYREKLNKQRKEQDNEEEKLPVIL